MKKITFLFTVFCFSLNAQVIITVAGNHANGFSGDGGPAKAAELNFPTGVTFDAFGNLYIADRDNNRVRMVSTSGIMSTVAGNGTAGFTGDGGQATAAELSSPYAVALDAAGNLYIADLGNQRIRKVNTAGNISTIVGTGIAGFSGDGGPAISAQLFQPCGMAFDAAGNLFIADEGNRVIRKVNNFGVISTFAGNNIQGYSGDGGLATSAQLNNPQGIAFDATGNLYISDTWNHRVRMVNTSGIINTIVGTGTQGDNGDGGLANVAGINNPAGIAIDPTGNIYIASYGGSVIRKVNSSGIISTFAGITNTAGYTGDGGLATIAELYLPMGIALDANGSVYIADFNNNVIREAGMCLPPIPAICMIEVDSLSLNNIIYWDKTQYPSADTFYIYRDTSNNNYAQIGKVLKSALSMFKDTVRTLYAANGDPNVTSWRYKISYHDTCGNIMSPMSPWHQTIYQYNIGGLFVWNHYQIEGQTTPVPGLLNYLLKRDNAGNTGNYILAATASASSTNINDPQYSTYQTTADWRVETLWNISCTPTLRLGNNSTQTAVVKSRSNVKNNRTTSINKFNNGDLKIYPNPANDAIAISLSKNCNNCQIEIINLLGETVKNISVVEMESKITIAEIINGVYFVKVVSNNKVQCIQKLIVQH